MMNRSTSLRTGLVALVALAGVSLAPSGAQAWWRGGVYFGGPVVIGPPVLPYPYAYPPAYYPPAYYPAPYPYGYAPPAATSAPQASAPSQSRPAQLAESNAPYGSRCYAGVYICGAPTGGRVGQGCSCPAIGAPSYGVVQ